MGPCFAERSSHDVLDPVNFHRMFAGDRPVIFSDGVCDQPLQIQNDDLTLEPLQALVQHPETLERMGLAGGEFRLFAAVTARLRILLIGARQPVERRAVCFRRLFVQSVLGHLSGLASIPLTGKVVPVP
jgi:hypothetical protein